MTLLLICSLAGRAGSASATHLHSLNLQPPQSPSCHFRAPQSTLYSFSEAISTQQSGGILWKLQTPPQRANGAVTPHFGSPTTVTTLYSSLRVNTTSVKLSIPRYQAPCSPASFTPSAGLNRPQYCHRPLRAFKRTP